MMRCRRGLHPVSVRHQLINDPAMAPKSLFVALLFVCLLLPLSLRAQEESASDLIGLIPLVGDPVMTVNDGHGMTLDLFADALPQGQILLARVSGTAIYGVQAEFLGQRLDFFPMPDGAYYALLGAGLETPPGEYPLLLYTQDDDTLTLTVNNAPPTPARLVVLISVTAGDYIQQAFNIPADRAYLLDAGIEAEEVATMQAAMTAAPARTRFWFAPGGGFQLPLDAQITSPFGAFRTLNGTFQTRHTGWDLRAAVGTPVMAMAAGRVVLAETLAVRGGQVLVGHGYGMFSGYSHLSELLVAPGDGVARGQVIGLSGSSGRVNGPHLHWEVILHGQWVDALQFLAVWNGEGE